MTCGVFWLLLISPPLNANPQMSRYLWANSTGINTGNTTVPFNTSNLQLGPDGGPTALLEVEKVAAATGGIFSNQEVTPPQTEPGSGEPPNQT